MRTLTFLLGCFLSLTLAGSAVAGPRRGVVAPLNPLGIDPPEALRVQRWIAAALATVPGHRWLLTSRMERVLSQPRYRDCEADPVCMAKAAGKVGADLVVTGDVGSMSGAFMVYLRLISRDGSTVRSVNGVLDPGERGLRATARGLAFRLLAPEQYTGAIQVEVDVPNAWIYLDGRRVARSPEGHLKGIPVGTHALRVTQEAYRDFVRFVKVEFGQTVKVRVELSAFPVGTGEMRLVGDKPRPLTDSELPWYRRWWAVAGFGAVVLAATTTTVALLVNRAISRDSEVVVRP